VTAKLDEVRGSRGLAAYVFVEVQALAEEEIDWSKDGGADAVEASLLGAGEQRSGADSGGFEVQFGRALLHRFVEILDGMAAGFVGLELPASAADGAEMVAAGFKDLARLGCVFFGHQEVEVELRTQFKLGDRDWPEGEAL